MDLQDFFDLLISPQMQYFALFLIVGLGYALGRIQIKGISLDVSAIIFVAMLFGHWGVKLPSIIQNVGLVLFIFTIGIQSGPGFFDAMKKHGVRLAILATIMSFIAGIIAVSSAFIFGIDMDTMAGVLAGAMTSTPGLASATEIFNAAEASIGYGVAYPFGVLGVILVLRFLPRLAKVDIARKEKEWESESHSEYPDVLSSNLRVTNNNVYGRTLAQLHIRRMTDSIVSRVKHQGEDNAFAPTVDTVMQKGDLVRIVGTQEALDQATLLLGTPTDEEIPFAKNYDARTLLVTNKSVVNVPLSNLNLMETYGATVTRIRRSGIDILPNTNSRLRFADKIVVTCDTDNLVLVEKLFGNQIKQLDKTDFLPMALGITIGILLGKFTPLGLTGGVLFTALIFGRIGKTGPILWTMSGSANSIIRELGLILFLTVVGTEAGATIVQKFQEVGFLLFGIGALITLVPLLAGLFIATKIFKLNFLSMLGALSGGMTSTPALAAITPITTTNAPQIAYATIYPIAMVVLVIVIQLMSVIAQYL